MQEYKNQVMSEAEELLLKKFPERLSKIGEILNSERLNINYISSVKTEINIPLEKFSKMISSGRTPKRRKLDDLSKETSEAESTETIQPSLVSVPSNEHITGIIAMVKPRIQQFLEDVNVLKMWVRLLIPQVESGDNFWVSVQEGTIQEITAAENTVYDYFVGIGNYHHDRGCTLARLVRLPNLEDIKRNVQEDDEMQFCNLRFVLREMMNQYVILHDIITKNLEKIKKPRSSNLNTMI